MRFPARFAPFVTTLLLLPSAVGCSSPRPADAAAVRVPVRLKDFRVDVGRAVVGQGRVRFEVVNRGPTTHELDVVRTDLPENELPLDADRLTVVANDARLVHLGEAEGLDIDDHRTLTVDLAPGHYVLYCNMEGHYLARMHTSLEVR